MSISKVPKITWGASFANTLNIGWPLDNPSAHSEPGPGSEQARVGATVDAWITGTHEVLEGDIRWIPGSNGTTPGGLPVTGWDGGTGVKAFLEWARNGNAFRFYPDKDAGTYHTCYLLGPVDGGPGAEQDGTRRIRIRILDDGTQGAFTGYTYSP